FLAPFALTILGFSTSSASNERFSRGASAVSGLLGFAGFFAGFASAATGAAASGVSVGCAASSFTSTVGGGSSAFGFLVAFSALGFAGFLSSAIVLKPCLLFLLSYVSLRPFSSSPCACGH